MRRNSGTSIDKHVLRALSRRTVFPWIRDAACDWLVVVLVFAGLHLYQHPVSWIVAILVLGNRQHALAILGHDGTHYTLSHDKKLNDFLTNCLAFWPIGLTVSGYRALHFKHHRHTGTEDDPEMNHKRARSPQWDLPARPAGILKYAVLDLFGGSFPDYMIILKYSKPDRRADYIPLIAFHLLSSAALIALGLWWVPCLWYAALVTTFMMFFRLRLWLEHQGTSETHRLFLNFWQAPLLAPHKSWMHWEHHAWPMVPYHQLAALREHTPEHRVMSLAELLTLFRHAAPLRSGQVVDRGLQSHH